MALAPNHFYYDFANMRKLDQDLLLLSGKKKILTFDNSLIKEFNSKRKQLINNDLPKTTIFISSKKITKLASLKIPDKIDLSKKTLLVIKYTLRKDAQLGLIINGTLYKTRGKSHRVVVVLDKQNIDISIKGFWKNKSITIKDISIYQ